jgi:hypothetical protein
MSTPISGATYTSFVSGIAITSGGASNTMGGGREIPILTSTPAIAGTEATIAHAKRIVHKSNFFIMLPPYLVFGIIIRTA